MHISTRVHIHVRYSQAIHGQFLPCPALRLYTQLVTSGTSHVYFVLCPALRLYMVSPGTSRVYSLCQCHRMDVSAIVHEPCPQAIHGWACAHFLSPSAGWKRAIASCPRAIHGRLGMSKFPHLVRKCVEFNWHVLAQTCLPSLASHGTCSWAARVDAVQCGQCV